MGLFKNKVADDYEDNLVDEEYDETDEIEFEEESELIEDIYEDNDFSHSDYENNYEDAYQYQNDENLENGLEEESAEGDSDSINNDRSTVKYKRSTPKRNAKRDYLDENSDEDEKEFPYNKVIAVLLLMVLGVVTSYFGTKFYIREHAKSKLSKTYLIDINGVDLMKSSLASYVPTTYIEDPLIIVERYAIDTLLNEKLIQIEEEDVTSVKTLAGFKDMTIGEQQKVEDDYRYKIRKDRLLTSYLENFRNESNTNMDTTFNIDCIETESGNTVSLTLNSKTMPKDLQSKLENLTVSTAIYNVIINGINYSTVSLISKNVNYEYKPEVIIQAKDTLDLELNNKMALNIVTKREE